jgi:hypothetical protein
MEIITNIPISVLAIAAILLIVFLAIVAILSAMKRGLEARIAEKYAEHEIVMKDLMANSFGRESKGLGQIRGNGALVLSKRGLHFFQIIPRHEVFIPLSDIVTVQIVKSHLGKATIHDLLRVEFKTDGGLDAMAWFVVDVPQWKHHIEMLRPDLGPDAAGEHQ